MFLRKNDRTKQGKTEQNGLNFKKTYGQVFMIKSPEVKNMAESNGMPVCEEESVHCDTIARAKALMPEEEKLFDLAELYKIFGDTTRIKILYLLFESEMCVCDIAKGLGMTVSAVSHQLRVLKGAKLIKFRKDGKSVIYSLADEHVSLILGQGMEHINE